jgi:phosphoglycolate phosphatase
MPCVRQAPDRQGLAAYKPMFLSLWMPCVRQAPGRQGQAGAACDDRCMVDTPSKILERLPETLILWDVDHTLIENGGVGKEVHALAFKLLTGRVPVVRPVTDGRTDFQIMRELLEANSIDATGYVTASQFEPVLIEAMAGKAPELPDRGHVLPGVVDALEALEGHPAVVQSVLTGNIMSNARRKLAAFGLDTRVDLDVGGFGSDHIVRSRLVDSARVKVKRKYGRGFDASSTILIGDTPLDVRAAHDGGAKIVAVATGVYSAPVLAELGADAVLENLADLSAFAETLVAVRTRGGI